MKSLPVAKYCLLLWILLLQGPLLAFGQSYEPSLGQSRWLADSSLLVCRFYQPIPNYGLASFEKQAGLPLTFQLETGTQHLKPGMAALTVEAPSWQSSALSRELGQVRVEPGTVPVRVEEARAEQLLDAISQGMAPAISSQVNQVRVKTSPARFRDNYGEFMACMANLLPMNFEQLERSIVYFETDVRVLDAKSRQLLNNIALYVAHDDRISQIFIDGHADERGSSFYNRRLSEDRAMAVTQYLIAQGVPPSLLLTRYHGDAYPAREGGSASWAANRRVTLRLERF